MTTSLTERLRASPTSVIMLEAADYIDALEADNKRLREALQGLLNALPSATTHPAIQAARAALSGEGK